MIRIPFKGFYKDFEQIFINVVVTPLFSNGVIVLVGDNTMMTMFSLLIASYPIDGYYYRNGNCKFNDIQHNTGKPVTEYASLCTGDSTCVGW